MFASVHLKQMQQGAFAKNLQVASLAAHFSAISCSTHVNKYTYKNYFG